MTIYIMTQVTIIPPKSKYLSPSDRRSISLITVFDMPKVEATSSIFLRMPFSIDRWSRMLSMMVCPWLNKSSRPRFALRVASLCSKALSITENKLVRKSQIVSKNLIFRKIQFWWKIKTQNSILMENPKNSILTGNSMLKIQFWRNIQVQKLNYDRKFKAKNSVLTKIQT